jgi:catechol 2,3-dioxygenase-like lactoylglutathione lyase family enzyme
MTDNTGKFHHIEIYVSDLKRSSDFWRWFLEGIGYKKFQQWDTGISWKLEHTYIVFVQTENRHLDVPYHRCRTGLNHLAFYAKSKSHVDKVTTELKNRGVKILYKNRHPYSGGKNHYAVYFEDPDRIKVEFAAPD